MTDPADRDHLLELTAKIVSAHVTHNSVSEDDLPALISTVFRTLANVGTAAVEPAKTEPAVPIKKSVFRDHLVCLECAKSFKTLRRHLNTDHDLTPESYRAKWALPASYPMVAPSYAATRSSLAKSLGLGRKPAGPVAEPEVKVTRLPEVKRGRGRRTG